MIEMDTRKAFTFIEPGPVTLVTANDGSGDSLMVISWTMAVDFEKNCHIALSSGPWNSTFKVMMETGECVISVPPADMVESIVHMGVESSREIDKFAKYNLTRQRSETVSAPLIQECIASLECRVEKYYKEYGLVVLRCDRLWYSPEREFAPMLHANGDGTFRADDPRVYNYLDVMRKWVPRGCERYL